MPDTKLQYHATPKSGSAKSNSDITQSISELNNLVSVVLSHTAIGLSKLPANSPARDNLDRTLHAAEQLADLLIEINENIHEGEARPNQTRY